MNVADANSICRICGSSKLNLYIHDEKFICPVEECRLSDRQQEPDRLLRACECRGEFAHVHPFCLENWIETTRHEYCDICRVRYNVDYSTRSFSDWFSQTHQIQSATVNIASVIFVAYLSSLGLLVGSLDKRRRTLAKVFLEASSIIWLAAACVYTIYYIFGAIVEYRDWRINHRRVIVKELESPQLDAAPKPRDGLRSSGFTINGRK